MRKKDLFGDAERAAEHMAFADEVCMALEKRCALAWRRKMQAAAAAHTLEQIREHAAATEAAETALIDDMRVADDNIDDDLASDEIRQQCHVYEDAVATISKLRKEIQEQFVSCHCCWVSS